MDTVTNRKSKTKNKASSSNVVGDKRETEEDVASLTSSGDKEFAFAADTSASCKPYLKQYGELIVDSPQPVEEAIEQSTRPSVK